VSSSSERLPSLELTNRLVLRSQRATAQAREYNDKLSKDGQEQLYLAGMNALAEKFWALARSKTSDPQEIRTYADLLLRHFEQKHKEKKTAIMERQLALLEEKAKALRAAVSDRSLTDTEFYSKIREICFPANYGRPGPEIKAAKLLHNGNGFTS
jgi:hypothetical protein